ncbi:hypothetical protein [Dongshaea marina]|uniref:hypothetical protein n=1 Tax=Dongshaea marina TaxID=2047966 RepID=UPI000D3ECB84|nr:hypothetical protein [Dongshaea marina]
MKLIYSAQQLRIRLSEQEYSGLEQGQPVELTVSSGELLLQNCRVELDRAAQGYTVASQNPGLLLKLTPELVAQIPHDSKHGLCLETESCQISVAIDLKR